MLRILRRSQNQRKAGKPCSENGGKQTRDAGLPTHIRPMLRGHYCWCAGPRALLVSASTDSGHKHVRPQNRDHVATAWPPAGRLHVWAGRGRKYVAICLLDKNDTEVDRGGGRSQVVQSRDNCHKSKHSPFVNPWGLLMSPTFLGCRINRSENNEGRFKLDWRKDMNALSKETGLLFMK